MWNIFRLVVFDILVLHEIMCCLESRRMKGGLMKFVVLIVLVGISLLAGCASYEQSVEPFDPSAAESLRESRHRWDTSISEEREFLDDHWLFHH